MSSRMQADGFDVGRWMREPQLARVRARLERFFSEEDPAVVLAPEALADVGALLGTVPDPSTDLEVAHAAGWLRWARYLVLDPDHDQQDLVAALALFAPVYQARPGAVPDQVRAHFDENRPDSPEMQATHAARLLGEVMRTGDLASLDTAVGLL